MGNCPRGLGVRTNREESEMDRLVDMDANQGLDKVRNDQERLNVLYHGVPGHGSKISSFKHMDSQTAFREFLLVLMLSAVYRVCLGCLPLSHIFSIVINHIPMA